MEAMLTTVAACQFRDLFHANLPTSVQKPHTSRSHQGRLSPAPPAGTSAGAGVDIVYARRWSRHRRAGSMFNRGERVGGEQ